MGRPNRIIPLTNFNHRVSPARVAGFYLVFSLVWIWVSDVALIRIGIQGELGFWAAAGKGSAFVALTAVLLYWLVAREVHALVRVISLLRAVVDSTTDAVFVKDRDGKYMLMNEAGARSIGKSVSEVLGKDDADFFDARSVAIVRSRDQQVMASGQASTAEEELTNSGMTRTLMATKAPYRDSAGNIIGLVGISRDVTDRQLADRALRASEERYRALVELAPEAITLVRDGRVAFANAVAARIMKASSPESILGLRLNDYLHPDDFVASCERQKAILEQGQTFPPHEVRVQRIDRVYIDVEVCAGPCVIDGKRGIQLIARDITERKRAAAFLSRQNAILEQIATGAPISDTLTDIVCMVEEQLPGVIGSVLLLDRDGRHLRLGAAPHLPADYNEAVDGVAIGPSVGSCGTAAYTREPVYVADIATDPLWANYKHLALAHGLRACWSTPIFAALRSGTEQTVLGTFAVYAREPRVPDSRFSELIARAEHMACIAIESDRAACDLRESEERLRTLVDHVWSPIAMFDRDMRYIHISRRWLTDYRLGDRNIIGLSHYAVFPEVSERWRKIHKQCLVGAVERCEEDRFERADGTVQWLRWEIQPWRQADGEVGGIIMFTEDITARKKMESQLQQSQKMEAVGRLAGGIAHDFNNLLTVINGFSDLILHDLPPTDSHRDALTQIRAAGDRAARLTQQLLAYSRKAIVEPKILDLNELVSESTKLLRRLIGEDVVVTTNLQPGLDRIKMDRGQIEQVLLNLIVNARDAMPRGGQIFIETRNVSLTLSELPDDPDLRPGQYARLVVSDTGSGMTEDVKAKIFEPFYTTKEQGKGTGLGLAVVQGAVKQTGGHISVMSQVGVGATFTILFPSAVDLPPPPSALLKRPVRGTETILLAEDEEGVRALARFGLENEGYTVLTADSGVDAVRRLQEHGKPIDLLVTDVVMPQMSGRELAEFLRKRQPGLRVLYMSGYTDDVVVRHGLAEATDDFLQKPFTPMALARKVREVLDARI